MAPGLIVTTAAENLLAIGKTVGSMIFMLPPTVSCVSGAFDR